ncbi:copper resistance CopC/CopD family protein [Dactylosporangium sucinum]|uniref:copper resistance CopC/CopD family protein n=1 Tax=Dactylosporangium sucinum TaxID=1424081 RepID=UPI001E578CB5|nr:copper resistance protein CopC [Dactylosporangium sucinum]
MLVTILPTAAVLLLWATPARAHADVEGTTPASGAVVQNAPDAVVLTFSEAVRAVPDKIRVTGPDGQRADLGRPAATDRQLRIPLRSGGGKGTYLVSYRVVSADDHPITGGFTYSLIEPSATPPTASDADAPPTPPSIAFGVAVARYVGYGGLVLLAGPMLVLCTLWPRRLPVGGRTGPATLARAGVWASALAAVAELALQFPYTLGADRSMLSAESLRAVIGSPFGVAHLVRLGVVVGAALVLRRIIAGRVGRPGIAVVVTLAVLGITGLATWPVAGHPIAGPIPALTVVADVAHLGAMAVWLGGLTVVLVSLSRRASPRELAVILPVWSDWAMLAVTVLVLAGVAQALVQVGTLDGLTGTAYGRLVLAKAGLLAVVLGVAQCSRMLVAGFTDRPDADPADAQDRTDTPRIARLQRTVLAEVAITAVVLAATAALVQTTPARTAQAGPPSRDAFNVTVTTNLFQLGIDIAPARTGVNTVHLYATDAGGRPIPVAEWSGTAALPDRGIEPIAVPLLALTSDHASGQLTFPVAGDWQLRFTVRIDETNRATATTTIQVR